MFRRESMNYKNSMIENPKLKGKGSKNGEEGQKKEEVAMVSVGLKKQMKSGYWSKNYV